MAGKDDWGFDQAPEGFWDDVLGVAVAVLTIERGGELVVPAFRIKEAHSRAKIRYPKGMHLHMESGPDGGIKLITSPADSCPHSNDEERVGNPVYWGGKMATTMAGATVEVDGKRRLIDDDTHLTKDELRQINHAYHLLLAVALARTGGSLEITKEDYDAATMGVGKFGRGALSITKNGPRFSAALISDVAEGEA